MMGGRIPVLLLLRSAPPAMVIEEKEQSKIGNWANMVKPPRFFSQGCIAKPAAVTIAKSRADLKYSQSVQFLLRSSVVSNF